MKNITFILTLLPCLFFSVGISANNSLLTFEEMDRDSDGYISLSESRENEDVTEDFSRIDTNGDGKINITEFQAYMGKDRVSPPEEMETPEPGAAPY